MDTTNLLRLLTPDVAKYWETLYRGTVAAGIPDFVVFLSWGLLILGAAFLIPEMVLTGNLQAISGKLIRVFLASIVISASPSIMGKTQGGYQPNQAMFWQLYHTLYRGIYEGQNSFYARWLYGQGTQKGPIREAIAKLDEALRILGERRIVIEASLFAIDGIIGAIPGAKELCQGKTGATPKGVSGATVAVLCRAANLGKSAVEDVGKIYSTATRNLFVAIMTLLGIHSAIIYGSIIMTYVLTFFIPLAAALYMYRPTQQAFPFLLGFTISVYLVLILSAVGFGASSVVLFNTVAARVEKALPEDAALVQSKREAERATKTFSEGYAKVMARDSEFEAQINYWKSFTRQVSDNGQWNGNIVSGTGFLPPIGPFSDPRAYRVYQVDSNGNLTYQDRQCSVPGLALVQGYTYSFNGDLNDLNNCVAELENARRENQQAAEQLGQHLTGVIEKVVNAMVARLRDLLFTFTILAGASVVLSIVLGMAMLWLITFLGRTLGGQFNIGAPVGGRPPV